MYTVYDDINMCYINVMLHDFQIELKKSWNLKLNNISFWSETEITIWYAQWNSAQLLLHYPLWGIKEHAE